MLLSVSTSGSKGVQRRSQNITAAGRYAFSIHKRIEGGATEDAKQILAQD